MVAPHFKDEIAGLQKWPAGFGLFWCSFFVVSHIYGKTMYVLQKNCPQMSFPGCREAPNIFLTFFGAVFFNVTDIYVQTMYILQKNCPQMSFPGRKEATNILHGGKMLAPHFKDEIVSLQK